MLIQFFIYCPYLLKRASQIDCFSLYSKQNTEHVKKHVGA